MEMQNKNENAGTELHLSGQRRLTVSGARSVDGFTENEILLTLPKGRMIVTGRNLKVLDFSEKDGSFTADGTVLSVRFAEKKPPLIKRLSK